MNNMTQTRSDPPLYFSNLPFEQVALPKVVELWRREQFEQRTPEWFEARMKGISASDIACALTMTDEACDYYIECFNLQDRFKKNPNKCCNHYSSQRELVIKKCKKSDTGSSISNEFMLWGQKYEAIVQTIYAQMNQTDVLEFGLLFHPTVPFLMASPDGITTKGIMLEIKCPTSRAVGPVPPLYYFFQMLMQLECCELEYCDFFDCRFVEYTFEDEWLTEANEWCNEHPTANHHIYGLLLKPQTAPEDGSKGYIYAPPTIVSPQQFLDWAHTVSTKNMIENEIYYDKVYYKLEDYYIVRVKRNEDWLKKNLPAMQKVWELIEYYRSPEGSNDFEDYVNKKNSSTSSSQLTLKEVGFIYTEVAINVVLTHKQRKPRTKKGMTNAYTEMCLC